MFDCQGNLFIGLGLKLSNLILNWPVSNLYQECKDTLGFNLAAMDHLKVLESVFNLLLLLLFLVSANLYEKRRHDFIYCICLSIQQLMALRSDALFRDAKAKLQEIRSRQSKRLEAMTETKAERRKRKKQKKSSDIHAWT